MDMFIYSVRASSVKFFLLIALTLGLLVGILIFGEGSAVMASATADVKLGGIKTNEDRLEFISQFNISVAGEAKESESFTVPDNFDRILSAYNEIQKAQGLNLLKYRGKELTRYTFSVTNYTGYEGTVYANVLVYRNRVVGGDVCSADVSGFVHGFEKQ